MFAVLRLWILAWLCSPTLSKSLPVNVAEKGSSLGGSEFDKAFAVVNAMFEQIGRTEQSPNPTQAGSVWVNSDPQTHGPPTDKRDKDAAGHIKDITMGLDDDTIRKYVEDIFYPENDDLYIFNEENDHPLDDDHDKDAPKETSADPLYVKAKDADLIMIDPLRKDDRNAAAISKLVFDSLLPRLSVTSDERGPGPAEEHHEDDELPVRQSRAKESDEEDEEDERAPTEGAPVVEDDLDDLSPETFKTPTVLGVGRLYKVGSAFKVYPVHIPNAPEHIELGIGVPADSFEEDSDEEDRDEEDPMEKELEAGNKALAEAVAEAGAEADADADAEAEAEAETEAESDAEDMGLGSDVDSEDLEPHATMSSDQVANHEAPTSEGEDNTENAASKKGLDVSAPSEDKHEDKDKEKSHDVKDEAHDEAHDGEKAKSLKEGSEKSKSSDVEGGGKKSDDIKEAVVQGAHQDGSGAEKDEKDDAGGGYGRKQLAKGYHDKYNFDKRTSRNRFYKNLRKKGDWTNSGEDEESAYKKTEGEETGSRGKYEESSDGSSKGGNKEGAHGSKKDDTWSKTKEAEKKEEAASGYDKGSEAKSGKTFSSSKE